MPSYMNQLFASLRVCWNTYPWLVQSLAALVGAVLLTYVCHLLCRKAPTLLTKGRYLLLHACLEALYWPSLVVIWGTSLAIMLQPWVLHLDDVLTFPLSQLFTISCILLIAAVLVRFIRLFEAQRLLGELTRQTLDETTVRAASKFMQTSVGVIAALCVLPLLGVNVAGLWAFGGGSAIVLGIAAREILANYFGGLVIYTDRNFKVGDWIYVAGRNIEGQVEYIGWRVTQLKTWDQKACYVPNVILSASIVVNTTQAKRFVLQEKFTIRCVDVMVLAKIVQEVRTMLQDHSNIDQDKSVLVHITAIKVDAAQLDFHAFVKTADYATYRDLKQELLFQVMSVVQHNGTQFS